MAPTLSRQTFTIDEVAVRLGIGRNTAYEAARRGEIPVIKIGKRLLVAKATLDRMLGQAEPDQPHEPRRKHGRSRRSRHEAVEVSAEG